MKVASFILCAFFYSAFSWSQTTDSLPLVKRGDFVLTGGLVAYYFWEEDSNGVVCKSCMDKPFLQNFFIVKNEKVRPHNLIEKADLKHAINHFAHDARSSYQQKEYTFVDSTHHKNKVFFPLIKTAATQYGSVIYILKDGQWKSKQRQSVLYFTIDSEGRMRYSHSNDSIVLFGSKRREKSSAQYLIYNYLRKDGYIDRQQVVTYNGEDVTKQFENYSTTTPVRILVFANGYRGPKKNNDQSDGLVTQKDRYNYWYKLDNRFIDVLDPTVTYYIDGSLPIATSSHQSKFSFAMSYLRTRYLTRKKERSKAYYKRLNTDPNEPGFKERKEKGKIAGLAFLYATCHSPECSFIKDTVDVVCHSMGYAYSLGFLEAIQGKVVFGNMYIIAAESACIDGFDWKQFRQVWQYGSNLGQDDADPVWEQDGVAPQCAVKGLDELPVTCGGRAFIPKDWPHKDFLESHMVYSYDWIFDCIKEGNIGYVHK